MSSIGLQLKQQFTRHHEESITNYPKYSKCELEIPCDKSSQCPYHNGSANICQDGKNCKNWEGQKHELVSTCSKMDKELQNQCVNNNELSCRDQECALCQVNGLKGFYRRVWSVNL